MRTLLFSFIFAIIPLQITPHNLSITANDQLVTTITHEQLSFPFMDGPFINLNQQEVLLKHLGEKMYVKPKNAFINDSEELIDGKPGQVLDTVKFKQLLRKYYYDGSPTSIELPTKEIYPRIDAELLVTISKKRLGHFTTFYKSGNEERSHNIMLATKAINNHVIFPGETFSFNHVVGKRTKEKGYERAPVIVKGELAEGIGGGICQVSSTLFNAVDIKGLEITERYSHSRSVPYVPSGRDATVSWYGPDFAFKNKLDYPILIKAHTGHGKMSISVYSSPQAKSE